MESLVVATSYQKKLKKNSLVLGKMTKENNFKVTKETNINEALDINPRTAEVLFEAGIGCFGCVFANVETIGQGLSTHGFSEEEIEEIIKEINKIEEN